MLYEDRIKYKELTDASVQKKVCVLFDKPLFSCIRNQTRRAVKERKVELENFILKGFVVLVKSYPYWWVKKKKKKKKSKALSIVIK